MRRLFPVLLLPLLLLAACYQADGDVVPASSSIRVEGVQDGRYLRPDGVEVRLAWNEAEKLYDVVAAGSDKGKGGTARAMRVASGLYLLQYMDVARVALLASVKDGEIILFAPTKDAERRLVHAHGLSLRPGPINTLLGPAAGTRNFFKDLAASGDFAEAHRMALLQ